MITKHYQLLDCSFKIANCNYLVLSTTGAGNPSEAMDIILNLTNGTKKTIKRYDLKEMFKTYKATPLNWDSVKILEEYKKYLLNRK